MKPNAEDDPKTIHLYRGAPSTRAWSKHKAISRDHSLCGSSGEINGTINPEIVNCPRCHELMEVRK